jgi:hypothetical protein
MWWLAWGAVFFIRYSDINLFKTLKTFIVTIITGSLIELLVAIPMHIIASRRPGCFAGAFTAISICAGISVMLWAFGPGIFLLFLYEKNKAKTVK